MVATWRRVEHGFNQTVDSVEIFRFKWALGEFRASELWAFYICAVFLSLVIHMDMSVFNGFTFERLNKAVFRFKFLLSLCSLAHKSTQLCLILVFGVAAVSGLLVFWQRLSVSTPPPSPINSGQTAIQPCQLWWEAGDCSVPAPKSERLCLDPPCSAALVMSSAALRSLRDERGKCWRSCVQLFSPPSIHLEFGSLWFLQPVCQTVLENMPLFLLHQLISCSRKRISGTKGVAAVLKLQKRSREI